MKNIFIEKSGRSKGETRLYILRDFKEGACSRLWKNFTKKPIDSCEEPAEVWKLLTQPPGEFWTKEYRVKSWKEKKANSQLVGTLFQLYEQIY